MTIKTLRKKERERKYKFFFCLNIILSFMLSGCSEYKESFATKVGKGSGWRSMSDTYCFNEKYISPDKAIGQGSVSPVDMKVEKSLTVLCCDQQTLERVPEKTLKVWFAPFQDDMNNLYEASVVQTIVQKGSWVMHHVKGAV